MATGFIQIPKAILNHQVWDLEATCKALLFELFMRMEWQPGISPKGVPIQQGQISCSYQWLADHVHISRTSVQRILNKLEDLGVITKESKRRSHITITAQTSFFSKFSEEKVYREQEAEFTPPTVEQVEAFCKERGNKVNPAVFVSYYNSKGWFIGNTPMRSWKDCVILWEKREQQEQRDTTSHRVSGARETDSDRNWYADIPTANLSFLTQEEEQADQEVIDITPASVVAIGEQNDE